ncbi:MAG: 2'-5' RNA ligase family protein [Candidatus Aenigmarchaeota archaeon]|nr:2'-5' RNA ligase family protein [Candidatus Aenigmarchaeota archaeon]
MNNYLMEFRFQGYAKRFLKQTIYEVSRKFKVEGVTKKRVVPHITLFGPFRTNHEDKIVSTFLSVSKRYHSISFKLGNFSNFDNKVIFVNIVPSEELIKYRKELSEELRKLCSFFIFKMVKTEGISDSEQDYPFHATIAFKDIQRKFTIILNYLKNKRMPNIEQKLLRVTLLKNGKILYEYDFLQGKLFTRSEALNRDLWRRTIRLLKNEL